MNRKNTFRSQSINLSMVMVTLLFSIIHANQSHAETIVFLRHGEKPDGGLGQLNCQGLNRALALPTVLRSKFGVPDYIFAPNPSAKKKDQGKTYDYIRPLATIEPSAIQFGLPINTQWGFEDTEHLESALLEKDMRDKVIFVAWEHRVLEKVAKNLLKSLGGNPEQVPTWDGYDFDSLYIIKISTENETLPKIQFTTDHQGLNGLKSTCP